VAALSFRHVPCHKHCPPPTNQPFSLSTYQTYHVMNTSIQITPRAERQVTETRSLPFGKIATEHMFLAEYSEGGWHSARILPFADLTLSPLALCLHYGQTVFEGLKAFRQADGRINIFRLDRHGERFEKSLERMCMPSVSADFFREAIESL